MLEKRIKTFDLINFSHTLPKRWIQYQLYSDMTLEQFGSVWDLDHCYPFSKSNLANGKDLFKCTHQVNLRSMCCNKNKSKKAEINHCLYLLQELKTNYFSKLNAAEG